MTDELISRKERDEIRTLDLHHESVRTMFAGFLAAALHDAGVAEVDVKQMIGVVNTFVQAASNDRLLDAADAIMQAQRAERAKKPN